MLIIPFTTDNEGYSLLVCLDDLSIERVKRNDPAFVTMSEVATGDFKNMKLREVAISYASEADVAHVADLVGNGKTREALNYLGRGFEFRRDLGDYDGPPMNLKVDKDDVRH